MLFKITRIEIISFVKKCNDMSSHYFISKNLNRFKLFVFLFILSSYINPLDAQISQGGEPVSFRMEQFEKDEVAYTPKIPFSLEKHETVSKNCIAYEFGKILPFSQSYGDANFGTQLMDSKGNRIWKATITSEKALALGLYFSNFYLPKGAKLFVYSPDKKQVIGAFTEINNSESGLFATELILGDKLVIEYYEPATVAGLGHFTIDEISHAFRGISDFKSGFGTSGGCEVNVNCSEGTGYENQKNSVVRLNIRDGASTYWCTGSVINNTNEDRKPYILSAWHCFDDVSASELNQMVVYFNYESATCENPTIEPDKTMTMSGATKIASSYNLNKMGSDFYLVLLNQNIPDEYNPYFMGWDRTGAISNSGVTIHHPQGDIKKISTYTSNLKTATYNYYGAALNGSWEVVWSPTTNGHGVTEGGSSGCPIYSQGGFLIGTLTGGNASCTSLYNEDYFGKFNFHWDTNGTTPDTQLKPWLDPINSGITILSGSTVGIEEDLSTNNSFFTLFPNPSDGQIKIRMNFPVGDKVYNILIYNMLGQSVYQQQLNITYQKEINLHYLQKGVYFIEIESEEQRQVQKISIQ